VSLLATPRSHSPLSQSSRTYSSRWR
jgi:hypothetical protein